MPLELEALLGLHVLERRLEKCADNLHRVGVKVCMPTRIVGTLTNPTLTPTLSLREREMNYES